jgi:Peptidase family S41/PDZ domain
VIQVNRNPYDSNRSDEELKMRFTSFRVTALLVLSLLNPLLCQAQLTTEQKLHEFRHLMGFYQRMYAPAAWKKQLFGVDLSDETPWLGRVAQADDIGMMELCTEYVASLHDTHSAYRIRATYWEATLGFEVDSYIDGASSNKILIDQIDRMRLPAAQYPFQLGDELVSVDGVGVEGWIQRLSKWATNANPRSQRSMAAMAIVARYQNSYFDVGAFPRAPQETGDTATVAIRRASGNLETYTIPWRKTGTPVLRYEPVYDGLYSQARAKAGAYELQANVGDFGQKTPIFALPAGFQQRLGNDPLDAFITGVFPAGDLNIGYVRIWAFNPLGGLDATIAKWAAEIAYLQANTDALVVDIMHNSGGQVSYVDTLFSYLSPTPYEGVTAMWRPSLATINFNSNTLQLLRSVGADPAFIAFQESMLEQLRLAYERGDALVGPFPMVGGTVTRQSPKDHQGNVLAYTKPIMLLTDDWSVSAADMFAALFKDNQRGLIFGTRTNGAGGAFQSTSVGGYVEGEIIVEVNLGMVNHVMNVPGYPQTRYWENVGIHPDIVEERLTRENLLNGGATFSRHMVAAIVQYVQQSQP